MALALITAGLQALDTISKGQQQAGAYRAQKITDKANAKLIEGESELEAKNVKRAGVAKTSQVQSLLSQAGVAGTSPTAQLLQDTVNQDVETGIMQTLLQGKLASLDLNYRARQAGVAAKNSLLGSYLTAGSQLYSGYQLNQQQNTVPKGTT